MVRQDSLNYSKWDHLEVSDSEEEDDTMAAPRVTRLDEPSQVRVGNDGSVSIQQQQQAPPPRVEFESAKQSTKKKNQLSKETWTEKGSYTGQYYWSQDRLTVTLRMELPQHAKHLTVDLSHPIPYADRHHSVPTAQELVVTQENKTILKGTLAHAVYIAQDDDGVDWTVDNGTLILVLYKATPMAGMTLWWKKVFVQDNQEIELTWVDKNNAFQAAWDEAHAQFRNKVREKVPL